MSNTAPPVAVQGLALQGEVHGGQQAIQYAHVYLFAANTTGYGGPGIAPSSLNASVPLLKATDPGVYSDSVGTYVLTTNKGNFSIDGDYTCTPNTQAYLYVLGGNPGSGTNVASGLLAALGNCPTADNYTTSVPYISINEISTVAAAYAMAGFASDATHVSSSGSALAQTGIANAFANATNLANIGTGAALATTPTANGGNGTVPHDEIITLANILASCINTTGTVTGPTNPTTCYTLFTNALFSGTSGTQPTDTASAAINIAHNPGTNVSNIFSLAAAKTPYTTTAAYGQPNDWTIGINYSLSPSVPSQAIAVDGLGNLWVLSETSAYKVLEKLSPTGAVLSGSSGYPTILSAYSAANPQSFAIDTSNDIWVSNWVGYCGGQYCQYYSVQDSVVSRLSSQGTILGTYFAPYTVGTNPEPQSIAIDGNGNGWIGIPDDNAIWKLPPSSTSSTYTSLPNASSGALVFNAIDGSGNIWIENTVNSSYQYAVAKVNSSGTLVSPAVGYAPSSSNGLSQGLAIDKTGSVWLSGSQANQLTELSNSGIVTGTYTGGGLNSPTGVAIDGAGNVWLPNAGNSSVSEFSSSGTAITPSTGYTGGSQQYTRAIAVDGSGNVWVTNLTNSTVSQLIGAATPVITPICAGLPAIATTDGSSKLGTRP